MNTTRSTPNIVLHRNKFHKMDNDSDEKNQESECTIVKRTRYPNTLVYSEVIDTVMSNDYSETIRDYIVECAKEHYISMRGGDISIDLSVHRIPPNVNGIQNKSSSILPPIQNNKQFNQNQLSLGTLPIFKSGDIKDTRKIFSEWTHKNPYRSVVELVVLHWMDFEYDGEDENNCIIVTTHGYFI